MYTALQNNLTSQAFGPSLKMHAQPDKCFSFVNSQGPFELISGELNFIPYSTRCVCAFLYRLESGFHTAQGQRPIICVKAAYSNVHIGD